MRLIWAWIGFLGFAACASEPAGSIVALECRSFDVRECVGTCGIGTAVCVNGYWGECTSDAIDGGCPAVTTTCATGAVRACGLLLGQCEQGEQTCINGEWSECKDEIPPELEQCDGLDNDCDGDVDEGCECRTGATRECGTSLGECAAGEQVCEAGLWGSCTGQVEPELEQCDGLDNDCDGEVDDGYRVGDACDLGLGCQGARRCAADGTSVECLPAPERITREVCDGLDNDCDGFPDATLTGSELISACDCVERGVSFAAQPHDGSLTSGLCEPTASACSRQDEALLLEACLQCGTVAGWGLCTDPQRVDLLEFDIGQGGKSLLEVAFEITADQSPLPAAVNLWYNGPAPGETPARKYLPLLGVGEAPGSYVKRFAPESACFPTSLDEAYGCHGSRSGEECGGCQPNDTCGEEVGCDALDFGRPELQVAVEFCEGSEPVTATVRIQEVKVLSFSCL